MVGTIFNIQRFSLFDGPGVRTVVFLKGCTLNCVWCHNPEGHTKESQIMYDPLKCIGCGECVKACPKGLHLLKDSLHAYVREGCISCGKCTNVCTSEALSYVGKNASVDEIMRTVLRDLPIYKESGGGLTLSGGEPLLQADFSIELLKAAKQEGISTAVETSGYGDSEKIKIMSEYTDLFLYDYKATGVKEHKQLCGVDPELINKNLTILDCLGANVILRCPIVTELNDTAKHVNGICECAISHSSVKEIQLEPYHKLGISKSKKLGKEPLYKGTVPLREKLTEFCKTIENNTGKPASIS